MNNDSDNDNDNDNTCKGMFSENDIKITSFIGRFSYKSFWCSKSTVITVQCHLNVTSISIHIEKKSPHAS